MGGGYSVLGVSQWMVVGKRSFGKAGFVKAATAWNPKDLDVDLSGQVAIVTGANAGLGRATAEALAAKRATVHCLCRNKDRGEAAISEIKAKTGNEQVHLHVVDVSDKASVEDFAAKWLATGQPINSLVLNAGVLLKERSVTPRGGIETTLATAVMQSYLLTGLLLPALTLASTKPARVVHVSSGGMYTVRLDIDDLQCERRKYDGTQQYAHAKRAQVMLSEMWAKKLAALASPVASGGAATAAAGGAGSSSSAVASVPIPPVISTCMHPGWAETPGVTTALPDFKKSHEGQLRTEEQGADTIVWLAASQSPAALQNGLFYFDRAPASTDFTFSGTRSSDDEFEALWRKCAALCGREFTDESLRSAISGAQASGKALGSSSSIPLASGGAATVSA